MMREQPYTALSRDVLDCTCLPTSRFTPAFETSLGLQESPPSSSLSLSKDSFSASPTAVLANPHPPPQYHKKVQHVFGTNKFWINSQKIQFVQKMSIRWLLGKRVCQSVFPKTLTSWSCYPLGRTNPQVFRRKNRQICKR